MNSPEPADYQKAITSPKTKEDDNISESIQQMQQENEENNADGSVDQSNELESLEGKDEILSPNHVQLQQKNEENIEDGSVDQSNKLENLEGKDESFSLNHDKNEELNLRWKTGGEMVNESTYSFPVGKEDNHYFLNFGERPSIIAQNTAMQEQEEESKYPWRRKPKESLEKPEVVESTSIDDDIEIAQNVLSQYECMNKDKRYFKSPEYSSSPLQGELRKSTDSNSIRTSNIHSDLKWLETLQDYISEESTDESSVAVSKKSQESFENIFKDEKPSGNRRWSILKERIFNNSFFTTVEENEKEKNEGRPQNTVVTHTSYESDNSSIIDDEKIADLSTQKHESSTTFSTKLKSFSYRHRYNIISFVLCFCIFVQLCWIDLSQSSSTCIKCTDVPTAGMNEQGKDCSNVVKLEKGCKNDETWTKDKSCRLSCYKDGYGYEGDVCC